ncbi:MAG TPA: hemerythrin domain-containing protein [Thermodesulfobacteriota bacterium]|nr:hemerythrin domain-containing protein [Thermodesulfobacteriota bacterium]
MEEDVIMTPIGILMVEHRLIERMIDLIQKHVEAIGRGKKLDLVFFDGVVDFARTYTDDCHHGKEEGILFDRLAMKNLDERDKKLMDGLVLDHIENRKIVNRLDEEKTRFLKGDSDAAGSILSACRSLAEFYPGHIEKEERVFFAHSMEYFSKKEQQEMVRKFWELDKDLLLAKYLKFFDQYDR